MMKSCPGGAFAFRPRAGAGASPQGGNCSAPWRESAFLPPSQMAGFLPPEAGFLLLQKRGQGACSGERCGNAGHWREVGAGAAEHRPGDCSGKGSAGRMSRRRAVGCGIRRPFGVHGRIGYLALFTASKSFSMSSSGLAVRRLTTMMAMQATMKAGRSS